MKTTILIQEGQWIFTCDMKPKQFLYFVKKNPHQWGFVNIILR